MGLIFAVSPGSDGTGPSRYVIYLPFVLAPGATVSSLERTASVAISSHTLTVEKLEQHYAASLGPFSSREEAAPHLARLCGSLLWLSLRFNLGIRYSKTLSDVKMYDEPMPIHESSSLAPIAHAVGWDAIDGNYDSDRAVIRPDHKKLMRWEGGQATFTVGFSVDSVLELAKDALSFPTLERVVEDQKLQLAIEIYAAYRFELSSKAQLLTLVTVLESLLPEIDIPPHSNVVLDELKDLVMVSRDTYSKASPGWRDLETLLSRVSSLKSEGIGIRLREYVSAVISAHPDLGEGEDVPAQLREVYTVRSKLLHQGHWNESKAQEKLAFLARFVPRLLEALFRDASNGTG